MCKAKLKHLNKGILPVLLLVVFSSSIILTATAKDEVLVMEWEQHWPTYGVGGTCNFGTHNFFVGDVDNDEVEELITGGLTYNKPNYTADELEAPLRIWNWNGENFTLEVNLNWAGILRTIYAADLNGDAKPEIITGGIVRNGTSGVSSVRVWTWDNKELIMKSSLEGLSAGSRFAADVKNDAVHEILTAGTTIEENATFARICILRLEDDQLSLEESSEWCTDGSASASSVSAFDLDQDGVLEIVTCGYDHGLTNSSGQLRIWHWDGKELQVKANEEWRLLEGVYGTTVTGSPMGNTLAENVKVADVDGDGTSEIVTGGFAYDGQKMNAQLRIWNWNGDVLTLEKSHEWFTEDITEIKAISLNDVNGDGRVEIVTSGGTAVYGGFENGTTPEAAQLRIWAWNGNALNLNHKEDWTIGEGVFAWNVGTGDIDKDGTVEIVTVGCMYVSALCDPDLRIWSLQAATSSESSPYFMVAVTVTATTVLVAAAAYLFVRRKHGQDAR